MDQSALLNAARQALVEQRFGDAAAALDEVDETKVDRNDLDFLRGTLAFERKDYGRAIEYFRAILARDPSIVRVRLDLARALYFAGDDVAATYNFHLAEAEVLPPQVQANVNQFLANIRRRKDWDVGVSVGVAPDSNVNAATVVKTVSLYGIPFELDQSAQKASGVGFVGNLVGSYQFRLNDDTRLVTGVSGNDLDYEGSHYDDRTVGATIGPRFLLDDQSEITIKAVSNRRWYAGQPYTWGNGGRIDGETNLSNRTMLSGSLDIEELQYDQLPTNSGPVAIVGVGYTYGLDAVSFVRVDATAVREQTHDVSFRDTQGGLGLTYYRDVAWGFGLLGSASVDLARYDAEISAFGVTRHDVTAVYRAGVSNKYITLYGFMPVITVTHTNRYSDIGLYAYERDRAEISLTRNF